MIHLKIRKNKKNNIKKESKKSSENSYLQIMISPFPTNFDLTLERLDAAFRNFAGKFHNYYRAESKKNQKNRVKTRSCSKCQPIFYQI